MPLNAPTQIVLDRIKTTPILQARLKRVISENQGSLIDADTNCREEMVGFMRVDSATMLSDLIQTANAWADWTGIVNELRGEGDGTAARMDRFNEEDEATKEYNGWDNKATWTVALWLDNDQPTYNEICEIVAGKTEAEAANGIQEWLRDYAARIRLDPTARALLEHELGMVKWDHVARSFMER